MPRLHREDRRRPPSSRLRARGATAGGPPVYPRRPMSTPLEPAEPRYAWSSRVESLRSSAIREILRVTARPDVISLAGGLPAPELFPTEALAALERESHSLVILDLGLPDGDGLELLQRWRAQGMAGKQFPNQAQVLVRPAVGRQGNAGLALVGKGVQHQVRFVDAHRLEVGGEQHVEAQFVFGGQFVVHAEKPLLVREGREEARRKPKSCFSFASRPFASFAPSRE